MKKIWPWFCALWVMNGLMRRGPVVVEHLSQQDLEPPALRAKVRKACKEALAQMKAKLVVDAPSVVPADEQELADVDSHNKSEFNSIAVPVAAHVERPARKLPVAARCRTIWRRQLTPVRAARRVRKSRRAQPSRRQPGQGQFQDYSSFCRIFAHRTFALLSFLVASPWWRCRIRPGGTDASPE